MRWLLALCLTAVPALSLSGCNDPNQETVMAPPMGDVDIPPEAKVEAPAQTYTDSSDYASKNVDASGDPGKR